MSDSSNEFYDIKISQDVISEKDRNNITNMLMKNEKIRSDSIYHINQPGNKCFFFSALILSSIVISISIYMCFIYLW